MSSAITFTSNLRGIPFSGGIYRQLSVDERRWTSDKILQILQNWTPVADKKLEQETHQEMSRLYPSVSSLYFATLLRLSPPTEGFLLEDLRKILHGGQRMTEVQNAEKYCRKFQPPE